MYAEMAISSFIWRWKRLFPENPYIETAVFGVVNRYFRFGKSLFPLSETTISAAFS